MQTEVGGGVALVTAVEDGAVEQTTFVVATDGVGGFGLLACSGGEHFVLKTALGDDDALFLGVLCQELGTLLLGCLSCGCLGSVLLLFQFTEEGVDNLLSLLVTHLERVVFEHIGDRCCEIVNDEFSFQSHLLELLTNAKTQCVTKLIHKS